QPVLVAPGRRPGARSHVAADPRHRAGLRRLPGGHAVRGRAADAASPPTLSALDQSRIVAAGAFPQAPGARSQRGSRVGLGGCITILDTGFGERPAFCAAYLVAEAGRAALIDCGTLHSVPRMLAALDAAGVARDAVDYLIATHVRLDHAGGAGALLRELPAARLVVHPRGAPHMLDPARLIASARQVYGDALFDRAYGGLVP